MLLVRLALLVFLLTNPGFSQNSAPASSSRESGSAPAGQNSTGLAEARQLIKNGKYADAIQRLNQLQATSGDVRGIHHELGIASYRQGDFLGAQSEFAKAIEEDPNDREAVQLRGISLYQIGRPAEAIPFLKQVQSWAPEAGVESSYVLALAYIQTRDYESARREAARMYAVAEDSPASYLFAARMMLRQGHDPVAQQFAERAAVLDPKLPLVHFLLGEFYLYKSDIPKAIQAFEQEIKINPGYAGTYDRLADAYSRIAKYDDAERLLRRGLLLDANATGPYILMGKVQIKKSDYTQAAMYLERAVKMDPSNYMSHHLLGEAYRAVGKNDAAERELKIAEQLQSAQHPQLESIH